MSETTIDQLTQASIDGNGVFDVLMKSIKAHLVEEHTKNRIKGTEYSTVYLGALQTTMEQSLQFLLSKQKVDLEVALLQKQGLLLDAQTAVEIQKKLNMISDELQTKAQTDLIQQQEANAVIEGTVLTAQECKLRAEFDLLKEQKLRTVSEAALLAQKKVTEQAQTSGTNLDTNSVLGKQIQLYEAQRDGYRRDAEQKSVKIMVDTWNIRKSVDELTQANAVNKLDDTFIGTAVQRMLDGITTAAP